MTTKFAAILASVLLTTLSHADQIHGAACEAHGAVSQVGAGVGANVFTCIKGVWERTSTVGPQRYRITAKMPDGAVYTLVALAGQPVMTSFKNERATTSLFLTATAAEGGAILAMNASSSEQVTVNQWSAIKHNGSSNKVVLRNGEEQAIELGELDLKVSVAKI